MRIADQLARKGLETIAAAPVPLAERVTALEKEVAALRVMVTHLMEQQLTVTKPGNALSDAEKQRAYRARLKAKKESSI